MQRKVSRHQRRCRTRRGAPRQASCGHAAGVGAQRAKAGVAADTSQIQEAGIELARDAGIGTGLKMTARASLTVAARLLVPEQCLAEGQRPIAALYDACALRDLGRQRRHETRVQRRDLRRRQRDRALGSRRERALPCQLQAACTERRLRRARRPFTARQDEGQKQDDSRRALAHDSSQSDANSSAWSLAGVAGDRTLAAALPSENRAPPSRSGWLTVRAEFCVQRRDRRDAGRRSSRFTSAGSVQQIRNATLFPLLAACSPRGFIPPR
jgi:hypothetical protein